MRDFVKDANDRTLIRMSQGPDSSNWCVAHLVIVDACDVDMSAVRVFADEDAIGTTYETVGAAICKGVIRATDVPFADGVQRVRYDGVVHLIIQRWPCVEFGIDEPQRFSVAIVNTIW